MLRRVFWFTVGAGAAVFVVVKVRGVLQQATPQALGQRVTSSAGEIGGSVRDFTDRVRAAMAEREAELRDTLGLND
jgi:NADH:ubiquinone oxidoreductase subunit D